MNRLLVASIACSFLAGCGSYGTLKGTVSYKNDKLKFGSVTAVATNGNFSTDIDGEGKYELKGLAVGKVKLYVTCINPAAAKAAQEAVKMVKQGGDGPGTGRGPKALQKSDLTKAQLEAMANPSLIPEKYADQSQTLLTVDVKSGENTHDIKLEP